MIMTEIGPDFTTVGAAILMTVVGLVFVLVMAHEARDQVPLALAALVASIAAAAVFAVFGAAAMIAVMLWPLVSDAWPVIVSPFTIALFVGTAVYQIISWRQAAQ